MKKLLAIIIIAALVIITLSSIGSWVTVELNASADQVSGYMAAGQ
jgi:hypothetical protein